MRLAKRHCDIDPFDFHDIDHACLSSEDASTMWGYYGAPPVLPAYGPQLVYRTIGDEAWNETVLDLAESVRSLCIFSLKHAELSNIISSSAEEQCEDTLQQLSKHFYFQNSDSVCNYLKAHHFLVPFLFEVRKKVEGYFGSDTYSNLELFTDPDDNNPKLFALILTQLSSDDASTRLDRLDQEWWLNQPREVRRVLNIDVDYLDGGV